MPLAQPRRRRCWSHQSSRDVQASCFTRFAKPSCPPFPVRRHRHSPLLLPDPAHDALAGRHQGLRGVVTSV
ncbi:hypothetical protein VFPFJ_04871 [Purpureocillium lilacinum]|uniref:Uncharacterized protein n=1 Tax=Purpureocillium lilacinum TaxID=33203 RepID=A0A179H2Z1_PURLI|nr:hypothetical protein VFPFJ_04871 [Purpureocillium lilacinum]OAQ83930.1 hypothetical protein VFPBJ_02697 [Purpureocillium lilacinum]OAQ90712.1 hypothetical protein VFPFJ_04871 [Purpureocillium lilacinum]